MNGFDTYQIFNNLKLHFTNKSYDYVKYHGKSKQYNLTRFNKSPKYHFEKFARNYNTEFKYYCIANFIEMDEIKWIKDIDNEQGIINYHNLKRRTTNLEITFKNDIDKIYKEFNTLKIALKPNYFTKVIHDRFITKESIIILNRLFNNLSSLEQTKDIFIILKYDVFIILNNTRKLKQIILEKEQKCH